MKRILMIEDDVPIGNMLEEVLAREGYFVLRAYSGTEALLALSGAKPDLVLLDLMLPGCPGEEVLPKLSGIPVIVLSAKVDTDSKVGLLLSGAADYVTKPFDIRELLARITVALRGSARVGNPVSDEKVSETFILSCGELCLDTETREIFAVGMEDMKTGDSSSIGQEDTGMRKSPATGWEDTGTKNSLGAGWEDTGRRVRLTRTEYAILKLLMQNPSRVIARSTLLGRISEDTPDCTESSLKMHVSNLRRKLRAVGGKDYIEAVWGIGFKLRA